MISLRHYRFSDYSRFACFYWGGNVRSCLNFECFTVLGRVFPTQDDQVVQDGEP